MIELKNITNKGFSIKSNLNLQVCNIYEISRSAILQKVMFNKNYLGGKEASSDVHRQDFE